MPDNIIEKIRRSAQKKLLFLPHTIQQMSHPERMITTKEIEQVVLYGELIENYPDDVRGHSCLILGYGREERFDNEMYVLSRNNGKSDGSFFY